MLIVIDMGNTNICLGIFQGQALRKEFRISTNRRATSDEMGLVLSGLLRGIQTRDPWEGVILSSVVPELDRVLQKAVQDTLGLALLKVTPAMPLPIKNQYNTPNRVGADRLVNAIAAVEEFGAPVIVADFGTAITVDAVSKQKAYLGGAILPGLSLAAESLARNTSLLQRVELQEINHALGRTTEESLCAGILIGAAGAVNLLVKQMKKEMDGHVKVIATGGMANLVAPHCNAIQAVRPYLTLEGLRIVWNYSRTRRR